jgi:hypothetical protein
MLKISIIEGRRQRRLIVEGKLVEPWTAELKSACKKAQADLHDRELVVEMKYVTTISQGAENALLELMSSGVRFSSDGIFTKHVLKQLSRRAAATTLRETNQ